MLPAWNGAKGCCCSEDVLGCISTLASTDSQGFSENFEAASSQERWRKLRPEPNQRAMSEAVYNAVVNRRRAARNCSSELASFKGRRGRRLNNCSRCESTSKVRRSQDNGCSSCLRVSRDPCRTEQGTTTTSSTRHSCTSRGASAWSVVEPSAYCRNVESNWSMRSAATGPNWSGPLT